MKKMCENLKIRQKNNKLFVTEIEISKEKFLKCGKRK